MALGLSSFRSLDQSFGQADQQRGPTPRI